MISIDPAQQVRDLMADGITIEAVGTDRVEVSIPFLFDDGDHLSFFADRGASGEWSITDDGEVIYRAQTAGLDLSKQAQLDRLNTLTEFYGVRTDDGALTMKSDVAAIADDIFTFAQTCLEATWLAKMNRLIRKQSTKAKFDRKLDKLLSSVLGKEKIARSWSDREIDPRGDYPVDYRIQGRNRQLFLFGVSSETHCAQATIACLYFKAKRIEFEAAVVYEEETKLRRRYADQLNDVVDRKFSRIGERKTIENYLASVAV